MSPNPNLPLLYRAYPSLRPLLFALPPEAAHRWSFRLLHAVAGLTGDLLLPPSRPLAGRPVKVAGLEFPNPIGLAAGLDKDATHLDVLGRMGFGFLEVGTVTPRPQPGNPQPRMFRLVEQEALINRLGFNNQGLETFLSQVRTSGWVRDRRGRLGLNIGKNASTPLDRATDDYLTCLRAVRPYADYITVNISSPNTSGLRSLQTGDALEHLLAALQGEQRRLTRIENRRVPMFVKIAPDLEESDLDAFADAVRRHEIEGVIATNTTLDRSRLSPGQPHRDEAGGLSGQPLREKALAMVKAMRERLPQETALIGVGGIDSGAAAKERLEAGADLVQLYTGLIYKGPGLVAEVVEATR